MLKLTPETRLEQRCNARAMSTVNREHKNFRTDELVAYAFAETVIVQKGGLSKAPVSSSGRLWRRSLCLRVEERLQGKNVFHDGRLQHDIAEILFDPDIALKQVFHPRLVVVDVAANEAQQAIVTAADKMTFHQRAHWFGIWKASSIYASQASAYSTSATTGAGDGDRMGAEDAARDVDVTQCGELRGGAVSG